MKRLNSKKQLLIRFIISDKAKRIEELEKKFLDVATVQKHFNKEEKLYHSLIEMLSKKDKVHLELYVDTLCNILIEQAEFYYKQGILDCGIIAEKLIDDGEGLLHHSPCISSLVPRA